MDTKRIITPEETKRFFNMAINSLEDAMGTALVLVNEKSVTFDFNAVLLLHFPNIYADHKYRIDSTMFDDTFRLILSECIKDDVSETTEYLYQKNKNGQNLTYYIKLEQYDETTRKLYIVNKEKLFETEQELGRLSRILYSGMNLFSGSTWWIDYDKHSTHFYQSDTGPSILGIDLAEDMLYDTSEFQKVREKARLVSPFYNEAIAMEMEAYERVRNNETDFFGGRTPAQTAEGNIVWVEAYGKCLIRYPDGRPRFFVAIDIYLADVFERSHQLEILNNLIDTGLISSNVGVWYYQKHFTEGRYYFTHSHKELMNFGQDYDNENISDMLDVHFRNIIKMNKDYAKPLMEWRNTHAKIFTEGLDRYVLVIPNHTDESNPQWIQVRGRVVERDEKGDVSLFVGVNVDVTETYLRNLELERLRIQNEQLQLAEKLAIKAGNVLVWYQDRRLAIDNDYIFANDMFYEKLSIPRNEDGLIRIKDLYKTLAKDTEEYREVAKRFIYDLNGLYVNQRDVIKHRLIKHINPVTKEIYYFEHSVEVEERDEDGNVILIGGFLLDVTENILKQERITYLANYDVLTNLHNRNYFEQFIQSTNLPKHYTVIVFDLDGLKLINDAFGHMFGDQVIKVLAQAIEEEFEDSMVVSRIGGDEFIVVTKETRMELINKWSDNLDARIREYNRSSHIELIVSRGASMPQHDDETFEQVYTEAENLMYRRKLNNRSSRKSKALESILETLNQKTEETKEHSERLESYAMKILNAIGYHRQSEREDMSLLARVHDIGKITIPDTILDKPSRLTKEEFETIKKHCEAGYQIIRNITDSERVSNGVLYHHERYDGKGYPQGLAGKDIPMYARIISVVDAFDAMTSNRVYQRRKSEQEAIEELIRCAGTQFDPDLVRFFVKEHAGLDMDEMMKK